jgi:L-ribulose-5-phosphate 3-epimerase
MELLNRSGRIGINLPFLQTKKAKISAMEDFSLNRRAFLGSLGALAVQPPTLQWGNISTSATPPPQNYPLCIFSKHLHWLSVPEMAREVAALGFEGVDLTVRKGGHVAPERVAEDLPVAVAAIRKAGLEVPMIVTDITDPNHPATEALLKTAGRLDIAHYRMGWIDYDASVGVVKSLDGFRKRFEKLAKLNQKYNIQGAYQNHSGARLGASLWDLWTVIRDLDPRWIGCQYDVKHAVAEGGVSWVNGLEILKNHIKCLDIKDFHWAKKDGKWQHHLVPLGEGMVDYPLYLSLLKKHQITGPMSIHYEFPLGGADTGKTQLSMPKEQVLAAFKKDLNTLQTMLKTAGLRA